MTAKEICREYRLAKNKRMQIKILSHENLVSEECISLILFEHGEMQKSGEKKALIKVLELLEKQIFVAEKKLNALNMRYKYVADFLKGESGGIKQK